MKTKTYTSIPIPEENGPKDVHIYVQHKNDRPISEGERRLLIEDLPEKFSGVITNEEMQDGACSISMAVDYPLTSNKDIARFVVGRLSDDVRVSVENTWCSQNKWGRDLAEEETSDD